MDQRHQPVFMVIPALNSFQRKKPTCLLIFSKISSHRMTCVTNIMKTGWRLVSKLCLKQRIEPPPPEIVRPCDVQKLINSLELRKTCGMYDIPNECLRHCLIRTLVHLTHLSYHCFRLPYFPSIWKEAKIITLPEPGKNPKYTQNVRPVSLLSKTYKVIENVIQKLYKDTSMNKTCYRHGVSAGKQRSVKIRLRPFTSLTDMDRSGYILH